MGAIKSRSPAESDGRISRSISRRYDARSSPEMLPEKSMKTTTADACRTAAGTEGVQPVVRRSAGVARTSSQGVNRGRDSTPIRCPVLAVHGDLRPQLQCGELRVLPEGERR